MGRKTYSSRNFGIPRSYVCEVASRAVPPRARLGRTCPDSGVATWKVTRTRTRGLRTEKASPTTRARQSNGAQCRGRILISSAPGTTRSIQRVRCFHDLHVKLYVFSFLLAYHDRIVQVKVQQHNDLFLSCLYRTCARQYWKYNSNAAAAIKRHAWKSASLMFLKMRSSFSPLFHTRRAKHAMKLIHLRSKGCSIRRFTGP